MPHATAHAKGRNDSSATSSRAKQHPDGQTLCARLLRLSHGTARPCAAYPVDARHTPRAIAYATPERGHHWIASHASTAPKAAERSVTGSKASPRTQIPGPSGATTRPRQDGVATAPA